MTRRLILVFGVVDDADLTDTELYELADRIVTAIDPDPPVLVYDEARIEVQPP